MNKIKYISIFIIAMTFQVLEVYAENKDKNPLLEALGECRETYIESKKEHLGEDILLQCGETPNKDFQICFQNFISNMETESKNKCGHLQLSVGEMIAISQFEKEGNTPLSSVDQITLRDLLQKAALNNGNNDLTSKEIISAFGIPDSVENNEPIENGSIYIYNLDSSNNLELSLINKLVQNAFIIDENKSRLSVWSKPTLLSTNNNEGENKSKNETWTADQHYEHLEQLVSKPPSEAGTAEEYLEDKNARETFETLKKNGELEKNRAQKIKLCPHSPWGKKDEGFCSCYSSALKAQSDEDEFFNSMYMLELAGKGKFKEMWTITPFGKIKSKCTTQLQ